MAVFGLALATAGTRPALAAACAGTGTPSAASLHLEQPDIATRFGSALTSRLSELYQNDFPIELAKSDRLCERTQFAAGGGTFFLRGNDDTDDAPRVATSDRGEAAIYLIAVPNVGAAVRTDNPPLEGYALVSDQRGSETVWEAYDQIPVDKVLISDMREALEGRLRPAMIWKDDRAQIFVPNQPPIEVSDFGIEPSAPPDHAPLTVAQVTAGDPVPLFLANCFKLSGDGQLQQQAYSNCPVQGSVLFMKPGDTVIELNRDKGYVAVDRPQTNGWGVFMMRPSDLRVIDASSHPAAEWTGLWRYGEDYARITRDGDSLKVETNLFSGQGRLEGDWLTIRGGSCKAVFSRVGRWLYAMPGPGCGNFINLLWRDEDLKRMGAG